MEIDPNLTQVAVLFGGKSTEHEVSVITGLEIVGALDVRKYQAIPVYIAQDGSWYAGSSVGDKAFYSRLPGSLKEGIPVTLLPNGHAKGLTVLDETVSLSERLAGKKTPKTLPIDVFLPAFHGSYGEDGCIQGLFEMANVAYVGSGVLASALSMNKSQCKRLLQSHGVPVLPWSTVARSVWQQDPVAAREGVLATPGTDRFPLFVKPCNLGSSIAISAAADANALDAALEQVFRYDDVAMVEPQVVAITELNVSVVRGQALRASVVERPLSKTGVLTYADKYGSSGKAKKGQRRTGSIADAERRIDPKDVPGAAKVQAQELALKAFQIIGCAGVARIDCILDQATGEVFLNEINPLPGSMSYYLWENSSPPLTYTALLGEIIEDALRRKATQDASQRDSGLRLLFP
ncbi:MAG: D-alanine--D-alanine ligase [Gammaproteobacteria bacterium]|nr:D-alanine--D-alanine ligase [Gammaproteobacteria bacterium]MCP5423759.1 D-alanine--D-alanine ligase [Gammaproteobacteria bacterium]